MHLCTRRITRRLLKVEVNCGPWDSGDPTTVRTDGASGVAEDSRGCAMSTQQIIISKIYHPLSP